MTSKTPKDKPNKIPKAVRELAGFLSLVYDETMINIPSTLTPTYIRCFKKGCEGLISTELNADDMSIHWKCSNCVNEGVLR